MSKNIVLVGLSGSGKTTVGKALKEKFPVFNLIDTDEIIVQREKRTINNIFALNGEKYFRELESQVAKEVSQSENQIISTGGGIVLNLQNIKELQKNGIIFYLETSPDTIVKRLQGDSTRPLLNTKDVKLKLVSMLEKREKLYKNADVTINTDNCKIDSVVEEIARKYNERS